MNQPYLDTARMMVEVAPLVFTDERLALKGGTAINLFLRDMPRLSVDLDLTFTDYRVPRSAALTAINDAIRNAQERLTARGFQAHVPAQGDGIEAKLLITRGTIRVKVEINKVIRGTVEPVEDISLTPRARDTLLRDLDLPVLSPNDVYGGKLVAALDRQHPRDLFDVLQLFRNEGITPGIRRSFVVYLASHNRPIHEVLFPAELDISRDYAQTFRGMTTEPVELTELLSARSQLFSELPKSLTPDERQFLISLANADPQWNLLGIEHASRLPAIKWKVQNLQRLANDNNAKLRSQADELARRFEGIQHV
jgi:predicted nucleotidyltransferase component of viral defense system